MLSPPINDQARALKATGNELARADQFFNSLQAVVNLLKKKEMLLI